MQKKLSKGCSLAAAAFACVSPAFAQSTPPVFSPGNLVLSRSVYSAPPSSVTVGQQLPPVCGTGATCTGKATNDASYPYVFSNETVDPSFGITSPMFLDQITTAGTLLNTYTVPTATMVTSFSSKSELGLNLSADGTYITFMGYAAPPNTVDVSNSNTPGVVDATNPVGTSFYRLVSQVDAYGNLTTTSTNAYSGNNGRAAAMSNGLYYTVGNAGNGSGSPANVVASTGAQLVTPGATPGAPTQIGSFSIPQLGLPADKAGKDNNYRGLTIYNNTMYMTKGSGSNGVNTVYQVGTQGTLPNASTVPVAINILPGFPTTLAKNAGAANPFGLFFANPTTLYVADEGDGKTADAATSTNAGLQKWILNTSTNKWSRAYVLQTGLNLGVQYAVSGYPTALNPATDGLRNITGQVNSDGTVTIWAVTSTASANVDAGADPNKLVKISDIVANTDVSVAAGETFTDIRDAQYGEVLRGISFTQGSSQTLQLGGVGSSAMFNTASLAAYQLASAGNTSAGHYTGTNAGEIVDARDANIVPQLGNLSVVWDNATAPTKVWYYLSADSVVGNRAYFAQPRTQLQLVTPSATASNLIPANLWGADAASLPPAVAAIINNSNFNAAFTDILPADAKFAQNRVNCGTGSTATLSCLGYGNPADSHVGTPIQSAFSTASAQPVDFNIFGSDPISGTTIPSFTTVPIGISPLVFLANRTNPSGLGTGVTATTAGSYSDITYQATAQLLFTGTDCDATAFNSSNNPFAISMILREPLSGTMNVAEFNVFAEGNASSLYFSQEGILNPPYSIPGNFNAIQPAGNNPLNGACPGGSYYATGPQGVRVRAIGTSEEVAGVQTTTDSIGYALFSYGNVSPLAASPKYGYLTYETVDPINPSGSYNQPYTADNGQLSWPGYGQLPVCNAPCGVAPGASFPNVRSGAYTQWSLLRAVADSGSSAVANLQTLANTIDNQVNSTIPDFMPFNAATDGDPGFIGYRSHFAPTGVNFNSNNTPNNGVTTPAAEAGGDVGGCLEYKTQPNQLNCRY